MLGRHGEAVKELREALRVEPGRVPVLSNLAWLLAACPDAKVRDGAEAVKLAELAVELAGRKDALALDTLGAAYAEAGRFREAVRAAEEALNASAAQGDAAMVEAVKMRTGLYRASLPGGVVRPGRRGVTRRGSWALPW